ncbi:hypothetical protein AAHE18_20G095600 [Arachis hypogaea]
MVVAHRCRVKLVAVGRDGLKVICCLPAIAFPAAAVDKTSNGSVGWWSLLSFCFSHQFSISSTFAVSSFLGNWHLEAVRLWQVAWIAYNLGNEGCLSQKFGIYFH